MNDKLEIIRVVVCAALRFGVTIVLGRRHFDMVMCNNIDHLEPAYQALCGSDWEQGFIDQFGIFMDRIEALDVALNSGQINMKYKTNPKDELFSEDLY